MILTNNPDMAARAKVLALHGMSHDAWRRFSDDGYKHYDVVEIGFKYNMMDLQAAIGIHQIRRVERYWQRRLQIWQRYAEAFVDLPVRLPAPLCGRSRHALHLYTILIDKQRAPLTRDQFISRMHQLNIGAGVHYRAVPEHSVYQKCFGWRTEDYPNATAIGQSTVSLPLSAKLTDEDVEDVISAVHEVLLT